MENPPNAAALKSLRTNKKKHDILAGENSLKIVAITPYSITTYDENGGAFFCPFVNP
tara:strand:+ start:1484 stop:1654 length:171 start_codon:yes stop_codon:yes gene_type:complete